MAVLNMGMFGTPDETSVPDPEEQNEARSTAALAAVIYFASDRGEEPAEGATDDEKRSLLAQNVSDLIADLMHLDDRMPFGFESAVDRARNHYMEESRD